MPAFAVGVGCTVWTPPSCDSYYLAPHSTQGWLIIDISANACSKQYDLIRADGVRVAGGSLSANQSAYWTAYNLGGSTYKLLLSKTCNGSTGMIWNAN